MLLNIYLGTTAISWATVFIFSAACEKKLTREGYKFVKEKKSLSEKIATFISNVFKVSIPVYNILNAIVILCTSPSLSSPFPNPVIFGINGVFVIAHTIPPYTSGLTV